jgi:hypothetical protein
MELLDLILPVGPIKIEEMNWVKGDMFHFKDIIWWVYVIYDNLACHPQQHWVVCTKWKWQPFMINFEFPRKYEVSFLHFLL